MLAIASSLPKLGHLFLERHVRVTLHLFCRNEFFFSDRYVLIDFLLFLVFLNLKWLGNINFITSTSDQTEILNNSKTISDIFIRHNYVTIMVKLHNIDKNYVTFEIR